MAMYSELAQDRWSSTGVIRDAVKVEGKPALADLGEYYNMYRQVPDPLHTTQVKVSRI